MTVTLDPTIDEALMEEAIARQFNSKVQKTRKEIGINVDDLIEVYVDIENCNDDKIKNSINNNWDSIATKMKSPMLKYMDLPKQSVVIGEDKFEFESGSVHYYLTPASCKFVENKLHSDFNENADIVKMHLSNFGLTTNC